jgi:copper(I)-binding protein
VTRSLAAAVASAFLLVGCSGDTTELAATDAWARPTPPAATDGVIYLTLTSDTSDGLVEVDVPPEVAGGTELHASDAAAGGGHEHGAVGGDMVTMTPVEEVAVGPDTTVEFKPGGNHIMLVGLAEPLTAGDTFVATLRFSSGRSLDTSVTVSDNPPS